MKYILVIHDEYHKQIPNVIEDYIFSLNLFSEVICLSELTTKVNLNLNEIFILVQMYLPDSFFQQNKTIFSSIQNKLCFLNVEMLTESRRFEQILKINKYTNWDIIDYSQENIAVLKSYISRNKILDFNNIYYFPYQFVLKENLILSESNFKYDVGIINAFVKPSNTNKVKVYKRNNLWEKINNEASLSIINILGWGQERDKLISQCKIIVNVHHFECFNIHESIRCDRLVFAKKMVISEGSIFSDILDTNKYIVYSDYEQLINKIHETLENFPNMYAKLQETDMHELIYRRRELLKQQCENLELNITI